MSGPVLFWQPICFFTIQKPDKLRPDLEWSTSLDRFGMSKIFFYDSFPYKTV
jgi:hypothetical protein